MRAINDLTASRFTLGSLWHLASSDSSISRYDNNSPHYVHNRSIWWKRWSGPAVKEPVSRARVMPSVPGMQSLISYCANENSSTRACAGEADSSAVEHETWDSASYRLVPSQFKRVKNDSRHYHTRLLR